RRRCLPRAVRLEPAGRARTVSDRAVAGPNLSRLRLIPHSERPGRRLVGRSAFRCPLAPKRAIERIMNNLPKRFWVGVASKDHVMRGVAGGFAQLNHGKAGPLNRMRPGDGIAYYSPRTEMRGGAPVQGFTAIGTVKPGEPYKGEMGGGFVATRR